MILNVLSWAAIIGAHTCDNGSIAVEGLIGGDVGGDLAPFTLLLLFARLRGEGLVVLLGEDVPNRVIKQAV